MTDAVYDRFDGAMATLTVHHWGDTVVGLAELRRVTRGPIVVFTFDRSFHNEGWLADYLPEADQLDRDHLDALDIADALGVGRVETIPIPHDCVDGFAHAYYGGRRPTWTPSSTPASRASLASRRTSSTAPSPASPTTSPADGGPPSTPICSSSTRSTPVSGWWSSTPPADDGPLMVAAG